MGHWYCPRFFLGIQDIFFVEVTLVTASIIENEIYSDFLYHEPEIKACWKIGIL